MYMKPAPGHVSSSHSVSRPDDCGFTNAMTGEPSLQRPLIEEGQSGLCRVVSRSLEEVTTYYESKTEAILRRYGPGPRVHYHTGLSDEGECLQAPAEVLRQRLVVAQERMLYRAAAVWRAASNLSGDVLDVGCGLGGGALFWAQEFGAQVIAVTCVPSHAKLVEQFAARAGVASKVRPLVCDALQIQGRNYFDAAVAVDSSCHLPRREWFRQLFALLRPRGRVFISDCFLGRREYEEPFNRYWHTRIGTIAEYLAAAREAGLRPGVVEDFSSRTQHFWTITLALIQAEAQDESCCTAEAARCNASMRAHTMLRQGLRDNGLKYALLSFSKD
jgi:SAM-dependent methyltransferase